MARWIIFSTSGAAWVQTSFVLREQEGDVGFGKSVVSIGAGKAIEDFFGSAFRTCGDAHFDKRPMLRRMGLKEPVFIVLRNIVRKKEIARADGELVEHSRAEEDALPGT